ncbi:hypothetical protein [Sphingosinicella sp. CPCC 101087]|uniref:WapI family immunity protein n=1 Tax=Sphingosinicella sp. CPCC 101087 TaxID=2497754 RepID=UPI00101C58CD|nr:hypothetical protein [Sphingosinicella sp. CPCC 101087]
MAANPIMREPDIRLDGLSIWVHGREFPGTADYWDGNWLRLRATMRTSGASVTAEGAILMTTDFERFRDELVAMHDTLKGQASLSGFEPELKVTLTAGRVGEIGGEVEITPDQLNQFHRFAIGLDQSYLPSLITSCDALIERYPVVGAPDA